MAEPVALVAIGLDAALGWPPRLYAVAGHPVGGFARAITMAERRWNRADRTSASRRLLGIVLMVGLIAGTAGLAIALERVMDALLGGWAWLGVALLAWPALAMRSLHDHVVPVADALSAGDLAAARQAAAKIVGRDIANLDAPGLARAAIESLAESFCDGVVAPLFWLVLLGLPGVWIYKAVNTADSLIGHREQRWRAFGWAAARIDDAANLVPARIAAVLLCAVTGRGWQVMWRDCRRHASPNAGWPEAAMAGALGVALAGPVAYDGQVHAKPWIGGEGREATATDIRRALAVYMRACLMLAAIAGGVAWLP